MLHIHQNLAIACDELRREQMWQWCVQGKTEEVTGCACSCVSLHCRLCWRRVGRLVHKLSIDTVDK